VVLLLVLKKDLGVSVVHSTWMRGGFCAIEAQLWANQIRTERRVGS